MLGSSNEQMKAQTIEDGVVSESIPEETDSISPGSDESVETQDAQDGDEVEAVCDETDSSGDEATSETESGEGSSEEQTSEEEKDKTESGEDSSDTQESPEEQIDTGSTEKSVAESTTDGTQDTGWLESMQDRPGFTGELAITAVAVLSVIAILAVWIITKKKNRKHTSSSAENVADAVHVHIDMLSGKLISDSSDFILSGGLSLGNAKENDIRIDADNVGDHHARLFFRDGRVYIEDLGMPDGVAVGGMLIQNQNPLRNGDVISIGEAEFTIRFH